MDSQLNKVVASPGGDGGLASCLATQKASKRTSEEITPGSSEMTPAKKAKISTEATEETSVPESAGGEEVAITSSGSEEDHQEEDLVSTLEGSNNVADKDGDDHLQDQDNASSVETLFHTDEESEAEDDLGSNSDTLSSNSGSSESEESHFLENSFESPLGIDFAYSQTSSGSSEFEVTGGYFDPEWDNEP